MTGLSRWGRKPAEPGSSGPSREPAPLPYEPRSWEAFAARWVRWVADCGWDRSPVDDSTGAFAGEKQPDDIWFLAGSFGGNVRRRATLPSGRLVFFPILNAWLPARELLPKMPNVQLAVEVDGVPQTPFEAWTIDPFEVCSPLDNPITGDPNLLIAYRVWGWWSFVPSFEPGQHTVAFRGSSTGDNGVFALDIHYDLTVV